MDSSFIFLAGSFLTMLYAALLLWKSWPAIAHKNSLDRHAVRLLQGAPLIVGLTLLGSWWNNPFLLFLLILVVAGIAFWMWRKWREGMHEKAETLDENVVDLPAPQANGHTSARNKFVSMIESTFYRYQAKYVQLSDGIQIGYLEAGWGRKTLLFIHGLGSNRKCWRKNILPLSRKYRCLAIDLPGYGSSSKGKYPYGMKFFAEKVREIVRVLELKNVVLVGHSMGGQIAMTALLQEPGIAQKLVLLAPAGFETFSTTHKTIIRNFYQPALIRATPVDQIRKNFEVNFYRFPEDAEFMIEDRLRMRETEEYVHYSRMIPQCVLGMMNEPVFDRLHEITIPALVLFGGNDQLIPNRLIHPGKDTVAIAEAGAACLPNSRLEIFRPCGHFVQWECAGAVNRSISAFLG